MRISNVILYSLLCTLGCQTTIKEKKPNDIKNEDSLVVTEKAVIEKQKIIDTIFNDSIFFIEMKKSLSDTNRLNYYINKGANVNYRTSNGCYLLFYATQYRDPSLLKYLKSKGAVDYEEQAFLLFKYSKEGLLDSILELHKAGADLNSYRLWEDEPVEGCQYCCECCAEPAISFAVKSGNIDLVKYFIEQNIPLNTGTTEFTPLYIALKNEMYNIADLLVENGALFDDGFNSLFCKITDLRLFEFCDKHDINYEKYLGGCFGYGVRTPIMEASSRGNFKVVEKFSEFADKSEIKDALCLASNIEIARLLIDKGAEVNSILTWFGEGGCHGYSTPLQKAIEIEDTQLVQYYIDLNADLDYIFTPNTISYSCAPTTPLILAIKRGNYKITELLIKSGADVNNLIENYESEFYKGDVNALFFAIKQNEYDIVKLLIQNGALLKNKTIDILSISSLKIDSQMSAILNGE